MVAAFMGAVAVAITFPMVIAIAFGLAGMGVLYGIILDGVRAP